MRFPQLPIGQRFSYQGRIYRKSGPLTASEEGKGSSRLIMKSAQVTPLDSSEPLKETKQRYSRREVESLCGRFRSELHAAIKERADPQASLAVQDVLDLIQTYPLSLD
jgi:hypothetical protein